MIRSWPVHLDVLSIGKPAKTLFTNIFRLVKIFEFLHWISLHILNESQNKSWFTSYGWFYFYNGEDHRFSRIRVVEKLLILVQSFCLVLLWLRVDRPSPFFEPFKISFFVSDCWWILNFHGLIELKIQDLSHYLSLCKLLESSLFAKFVEIQGSRFYQIQ